MLFDGQGGGYPERIDRTVFYRAYGDQAHRVAGYGYYRALARDAIDNHTRAARPLTLPVLAVGAQKSFGPAVAASWRQVGRDVREAVIADSGHFVPEEQPQALTECAEYFFGTHAGSSPQPALTACAP